MFSIRYPRVALGIWLLGAVAAIPGVALLHVDTTTDSVLDKDSPEWMFYQESLQEFGGDEVIVVAIEGREPLDPELLRELPGLSRSLENIAGVRRVDSLSTVPVIRSFPDGSLRLDPAVSPGYSAANGGALAALLSQDRIAPGLLISSDYRVIALNVYMDANSSASYAVVVTAVREIVSGRRAWVSGVPVFRADTNLRTVEEILTFIPFTMLMLAGILWLSFRSFTAIWIPLSTSGLGVLLVIGVMGALGSSFSLSTLVLPTILLAIGCAYSIHVVAVAAGEAGTEQLIAAVSRVAPRVLISGVTTAIGFASMALVRIDAIRSVGSYGALGVVLIALASLTFCPATIRLFPFGSQTASAHKRYALGVASLCVGLVRRARVLIILAWVLLAVCMLAGIRELRLETDVTQWFREGSAMRDSYEAIRARLSGISPVNVVIKANDGGSVVSGGLLRTLDRLTSYLESREGVGRALSIADPLRQLHGGFVGELSQPLPGDAAIEQYLLLLESMPQIGDLLAPDRSAANIVVLARDNGSDNLLDIASSVSRWWGEHGSPELSVQVTGVMFEFARAQKEISSGQIRGLSAALGAIGLVLLFVFRDVRLAVLALIPNAVPVVFAFGVMGVIGVPLDAGTILVGSLALGIAVDDTVHVVSAYHRVREDLGSEVVAMERAIAEVAPAVIITTAAIACSLGVLGLSEFTFVRNLGLVTAGAMLLCLVADLNLLPALLLSRAPRGEGMRS